VAFGLDLVVLANVGYVQVLLRAGDSFVVLCIGIYFYVIVGPYRV